jgi:MOSC domain-containing protein YiiM
MSQPTVAESDQSLHLSLAELEAGVSHIKQSPVDNGTLEMIVVRPDTDERVLPETCDVSPERGVHGDNWATRKHVQLSDGGIETGYQVTLMNVRALNLIARTKDRWSLAGDQLIVDFDLSEDNLKVGQRLQIGTAILEVTDLPHRGCAKFAARFGHVAHKFVNTGDGWHLHMRGLKARVVQAGVVAVGSAITKC